MEQQAESLQWEDQVDGVPFVTSLQTLRGPLRELLDFTAMASEDLERFSLRASAEPICRTFTASPTPSPDLSQSSTSLDFSLPSHRASGVLDVIPEEDSKIEEEMTTRRNEKHPMNEEGGGYRTSHKRFRVRRAVLEGLRRVESLVWQRYGVAEFNFPSVYVRHPLLYDSEAARMDTIWSVLHHQQRYTLAGLLFEILTIRLRDDFAISHLFNAGFLDSQYPDAQYWELLPYAEINPYDYPVYEDSDEDDEMGEFELQYPDSEDMQSASEDGMCSPGASQATSAGEDAMRTDSVDAAARDDSVSSRVPFTVHTI
ncbi:hypothetical protein DFH09DRAFT_1290957 [Mycena vulgaris]|nr:hypothetical protein DFH09DRAFT_1290957 [Mycena vulgaris]